MRLRLPLFLVSGASATFLLVSLGMQSSTSAGSYQAPSGPLRITSITPRGIDVPPAKQIVIQFDRNVVPIGRMERRADEIPITIEPELSCEWRWLNTSALACQLGDEAAFRPATLYRITVNPGIETEGGVGIEAPFEHTFETDRPKVTNTYFETWLGPGTPSFRVTFNQRATREEIASKVSFRTENGERFDVEAEPSDREVDNPELYWRLKPARELPLETTVHLELEAGFTSLEGELGTGEDERVVTFYTFPEHAFLGIRCRNNDDEEIRWMVGDAPSPARRCNPMAPVSLLFASPIIKEVFRDHLVLEPDLAGGREDYDPWDSLHSYSRLGYARNRDQEYPTSLPELLRARTTYRIRADASELLDEFGRALVRDIDFVFETDDRPPRAVLTHAVSTLERGVDTHVPIVVTNLDRLDIRVEALTVSGRETFTRTIELPDAGNVAFRYPLEARAWLRGRSGVVLAEPTPTPAVKNMYPDRFFTQVTPFAVHVKIGHQNTGVWVTDMATGETVSDARVGIYLARPAAALQEPQMLSEGSTDANGVAYLAGQAVINPELRTSRWERVWDRHADPVFFVRVERDDSLALVPLSYDFRVDARGSNETWIPSSYETRYGHVRTWGTTAQGVYRLGDTIQYKLYVRDQNNQRFVAAPTSTYTLRVLDPLNKEVHLVEKATLNAFGALDGEMLVPENGAVGWYRFQLESDFHNGSWYPLQVLVADFTPAPFRVTTDLENGRIEPGDELTVSTTAKLHAGGPYADADARVSVRFTPRAVSSENPKAQGFRFAGGYGETTTLHQTEASVDREGQLQTSFVIADQNVPRGRLSVESAVRDDRGKYIAGQATVDYLGRDRFVGIRQPDWLLSQGEATSVEAIVLDLDDNVTSAVPLTFRIRYRETTASRVKGAGNAYITQYNHTWKDVHSCEVTSATDPVSCTFTPTEPGRYQMVASILDTKGRSQEVSLDRWARGKGQVLWEGPPSHHLEIVPEKAEYRVGDTARFMIQNPFPGAQAFFTIERYGIQRHWVDVLQDSMEVIEVPVTEDHVPGFYFSAVVTSPRVQAPLGEDEIDLGKPSFRLGYVQIPVRDPVKEIAVDVTPEKDLYKPRDKVKVSLKAAPRLWASTEAPPIELAVAVLDEAVFDLIGAGESYFDPYAGFYSLEPLDVENFNLLTRLIGIQKFEKKGANPGGGGGGLDMRTLFKFVSYWNPSIVLDESGTAEIELEVPDNLTGWRVLAMAVTEDDRMGLGQGHFVVNQPTEIRPALPNQVTEGDQFEARFTVMNRTEEVRILRVDADVSGPAESTGLQNVTIDAEPYQRYPVSFPVKALADGELRFAVKAADLVDGDALSVPLVVKKRQATEVAATYGTTTEPSTVESLLFPEDIREDVGRVSLVASPSVLGNVDGAFRYMRDYPYYCWEQRLTKAVMASHFAALRDYISDDVTWPSHEELPDSTIAQAANFQAPNGGMVYWVPQDEYVSPYLSAYTALAFQWLGERGHQIPSGVETKLQAYLQGFLRRDVFPEFYNRGMASTVRAVALAALALGGQLEEGDLERYRPHIREMDVFGKAHFLMAANALGVEAAEVADAIHSHSSQSGGKVVFSESLDVGYERILYSPERTQCAVLSALTRGNPTTPRGTGIGDLPFRLTRTVTQTRGQRDHWENTQENVFCMNALIDYSRVYESETPSYTLTTYFDGDELGSSEFRNLRDEAVDHERAITRGDAGRRSELRMAKEGPGRLYYAARLFYSPKELKTESINAGMEIRREYSVQRNGEWVLLSEPMRIRSGELVRVDLFVSLPAPRNFVVVDDPVPGGLEPVNRDLATASEVDADEGRFRGSASSFWFTKDDWFWFGYSRWSFYHKELRHDSARFYSDYLPGGNYHLSYVAQAIAPGEFQVLPVHAEEMYDPDVFGQGVPGTLVVEATP